MAFDVKMDYSQAEFFTIEEGLCARRLHAGAFDDEPASAAERHRFLTQNG